MGHAKYIGRVGALAVTLGVGMALTSGLATPGVAYADPSADSSTASESPSGAGAGSGSASSDASTGSESTTGSNAGTDASSPTRTPPAVSVNGSPVTGNGPATGGTAAGPDTPDTPDADAGADAGDADDVDPVPTEAQDADAQVTGPPESSGSKNAHTTGVAPGNAKDVDATVAVNAAASAPTVRQQSKTTDRAAVLDTPASKSVAPVAAQASQVGATTVAAAAVTPAVPVRPQTLMTMVADFVDALLQPLLNPGPGSPFQIPILTAVLSMVRNEFERIFNPPKLTTVPQGVTLAADPTQQHVLVIGVDGTNLSRILADDYNQNFFTLMNGSTTAASSIVGHTTISNPSWTSILTGVWGERTGVINNVFTPWTYDAWPTVFNQLEAINRDIDTMTVANWNVINAISGAGSIPVDTNTYVAQLAGDTNWIETDDAVADRTIAAISAADPPNFLFSYYVGVDENGHMYGGASEEYKLAIRNMDDNLGDILAAVNASGEDWTIIVVTDHGHQPQVGFGHGFQSPDETATFVIANGSGFTAGDINLQYQIVDTTPTVVTLFGGTPRAGSDGVSLTTLGAGDVDPVDLKQALQDAIAMNDYPNIVTNVALGLRTIFATVPYYIFTFGNDNVAGLPDFLLVPVKILFDGLYVVTNVPAQIVAFLTGVSGARIFPILPPAPPSFPSDELVLMNAVACGGTAGVPAAWCSLEGVA